MSNGFSNDNTIVSTDVREPDAHGQAAMLMVESLIHCLIEKRVISVADAVEIVDTAREVKIATGPELGDSAAALQKSLWLLEAVSASLGRDLSKK
ncbi:hypothetical protein [Devosia psychrophila]|jgi:hypothetical protein|uniref:Uncharacterized protein n=1 Tax=Devosia psychrophila TaxID=728005 RepID=A0A0F5PRZ9_9HYPH|nr:hypothetical protein [Devosia psychrophila]KKC31380.1 hypothetical protein WH91_19775 [Devosia psychrophila]SFD49187.1 hypothetical protein SAMN04488059_1851 [Devosia psychrophila]